MHADIAARCLGSCTPVLHKPHKCMGAAGSLQCSWVTTTHPPYRVGALVNCMRATSLGSVAACWARSTLPPWWLERMSSCTASAGATWTRCCSSGLSCHSSLRQWVSVLIKVCLHWRCHMDASNLACPQLQCALACVSAVVPCRPKDVSCVIQNSEKRDQQHRGLLNGEPCFQP